MLRNAIEERLPETLQALKHDTASPQYRAFQWVRSNPPSAVELEINPLRFVQKYALAVFFYSTNGENWTESDGWLTTQDECGWFSTGDGRICDSMGRITEIALKKNNLNGQIPAEILLLSDTLKSFRVNGNSLTGTIPSKVFGGGSNNAMTRLQEFHVHFNSMSGAIPSDLSGLPKLQSMRLGNNKFIGSIPSELSNLATNLERLELSSNKLWGNIPFQLGELSGLSKLSFYVCIAFLSDVSCNVAANVLWIFRPLVFLVKKLFKNNLLSPPCTHVIL